MTGHSPVPKRRSGIHGTDPLVPPFTQTKRAAGRGVPQPVKVRLRRTPQPRTVVGLVVVFVGLALFLAANIGATTGLVKIPGDPHHARGQFVGMTLIFVGIGVASRSKPTKP